MAAGFGDIQDKKVDLLLTRIPRRVPPRYVFGDEVTGMEEMDRAVFRAGNRKGPGEHEAETREGMHVLRQRGAYGDVVSRCTHLKLAMRGKYRLAGGRGSNLRDPFDLNGRNRRGRRTWGALCPHFSRDEQPDRHQRERRNFVEQSDAQRKILNYLNQRRMSDRRHRLRSSKFR